MVNEEGLKILIEFHGNDGMIEYYEIPFDTPFAIEEAIKRFIAEENKWEWVKKVKLEIEVSK